MERFSLHSNQALYRLAGITVIALSSLVFLSMEKSKLTVLTEDTWNEGTFNRLQSLGQSSRSVSLGGLAGLRNRDGQGVYNIPVENHNVGWEVTDFPDPDDDQELKDAHQQSEDLYQPYASKEPRDNDAMVDDVVDPSGYASFYRAYSAYQLPHEVSNRNPRAAAAAGMAGWTDSGYYGLPRHGLPYSRPVRLRRQPPPAVRIRAGGDGSSNVFRIAGPGIINVTIGGPPSSNGGMPPAATNQRSEAAPAEDSDWATEDGRRKLQPCRPRGALPWLSVTPDTVMCLQSDDDSARFWQDAYDDAYY